MNITGTGISPASGIGSQPDSKPTANGAGEKGFGEFLENSIAKAEGLKFSKHASKRLGDRNIALSQEQNLRLNEGVAKAEKKGIEDSLIMVDKMAFIVNVPSSTVITAMDETEASDHIYTNIDGAVIA